MSQDRYRTVRKEMMKFTCWAPVETSFLARTRALARGTFLATTSSLTSSGRCWNSGTECRICLTRLSTVDRYVRSQFFDRGTPSENIKNSCNSSSPIGTDLKFCMGPVWPDWAIYWTLGNFLKPLATINLPKSPPFLGNFCKVRLTVKSDWP